MFDERNVYRALVSATAVVVGTLILIGFGIGWAMGSWYNG